MYAPLIAVLCAGFCSLAPATLAARSTEDLDPHRPVATLAVSVPNNIDFFSSPAGHSVPDSGPTAILLGCGLAAVVIVRRLINK